MCGNRGLLTGTGHKVAPRVQVGLPPKWGESLRRAHRTLEDYRFLRRITDRPVKMTLPGPCTMVDGVYDDYYGDERTLAFAFAEALREEIRALADAG